MENHVALAAEQNREDHSSTPIRESYHSRWTPPQDQVIKDNWGNIPASTIGQKLGVTPRAIRARARRLKLPYIRTASFSRKAEWPAESIQFLTSMWGKLSCSLIAEHVDRSRNAVIGKARRLGLPKLERNESARQVRSRKQRVPEAPTVTDDLIPVEQRKTLMELGRRDCRWPVGHVGEPGFFFCGASIFDDGSPYCAAHHHRAHTYVPAPRRSHRISYSASGAETVVKEAA